MDLKGKLKNDFVRIPKKKAQSRKPINFSSCHMEGVGKKTERNPHPFEVGKKVVQAVT